MTINGWYHAQRAAPAQPTSITDPDQKTAIQASRLPTFTTRGFAVVDTPTDVHARLLEAYGTGLAAARSEGSDPDYLPAGDPSFVDIGDLAYEIAHDMQQLHESWSGQELVVTAAYGIRTYRRGQTLRRHCDRVETHVISSVVHIDHESDAPWPLVIEDHDGVAHEIVLDPGQTLLYESATCPHSRPAPFQGEHYGSLFLHFKPTHGWDVSEAEVFAT